MNSLAGSGEIDDQALNAANAVRDALLAWIDGNPPASPAFSSLAFKAPEMASAPGLEPAHSGILALAEHAFLAMQELQVTGEADRLHRCHAEDCRWVFFDRSRNRSKIWCDMSGCGSRAKARSYRARRAASSS
jgi:predicted RNA-binding Zn ribbon-like protein